MKFLKVGTKLINVTLIEYVDLEWNGKDLNLVRLTFASGIEQTFEDQEAEMIRRYFRLLQGRSDPY